MHCAVSTSAYDPYSPRVAEVDGDLPRFTWNGISFGDWKDERAEDFMLDIPKVRACFLIQWAGRELTRMLFR
jgi:hypothetical protein